MKRTVKKPEERKADIIQAARHLFESKQYDKTSMQDVMDYLGIAKGTIYHYFQSKEELLEAVIEDIVNNNIEHIQKIVRKSNGNALQKIELVAKAGSIAIENDDLLQQLHRPANDIMHMRSVTATLVKLIPLYEELIKQGCKEGIFKTDYPRQCAECILFSVQFLTDIGVYPWTKEELLQRAHTFPKLIEKLLSAPQNSFKFLDEHLTQMTEFVYKKKN